MTEVGDQLLPTLNFQVPFYELKLDKNRSGYFLFWSEKRTQGRNLHEESKIQIKLKQTTALNNILLRIPK